MPGAAAASYAVLWSAILSANGGNVPIGRAMLPDSTGKYVLATAANRVIYGNYFSGISLTAGDGVSTIAIQLQHVGEVPAGNVPSIGSGPYGQPVGIDDDGKPVRVQYPNQASCIIGEATGAGDLIIKRAGYGPWSPLWCLTPMGFGAKADGYIPLGTGTDNAPAFAAMVEASGSTSDSQGSEIIIPRGVFLFRSMFGISRMVRMRGEAGGIGNFQPTSVLLFDSDVSGLRLYNVGDSPDGGTSFGSHLSHLGIYSVTARRASHWSASTAMTTDSRKIPSLNYQATRIVNGVDWGVRYGYDEFILKCVSVVGDHKTGSSEPNWASYGFGVNIADGNVTWQKIPPNHGILRSARAVVENCIISGFNGDGDRVDASNPDGSANGSTGRRNRVEVCAGHGLSIGLAAPSDCNGGLFEQYDVSTCLGCGVFDNSFLGNTHHASEIEACDQMPYHASQVDARSVFVGCYVEGAQAASRIIAPSLWLGGLNASGFTDDSGFALGGTQGETTPFECTQYPARTIWKANRAQVAGDAVIPTGNQSEFWFQAESSGTTAGSEPNWAIVALGGTVVDGGVTWRAKAPLRLKLSLGKRAPKTNLTIFEAQPGGMKAFGFELITNPTSPWFGYYRLTLDGVDGNTSLMIGSEIASDGSGTPGSMQGRMVLAHGYDLTLGAYRIRVSAGNAAPTSEYWPQGSIMWNQACVVGQPLGWRCTAGGTPGTWVAMVNL